jgi:hypothetical protein
MKDETLPLCIDFRPLNKVIVINKYILLRIDDLFDQQRGETIFLNIDMKLRYHQIRIKDEDINNIAFKTRYMNYEFVMVPFGLTNASTAFMHLMNGIFRNYLDKFFIVLLMEFLFIQSQMRSMKRNLG